MKNRECPYCHKKVSLRKCIKYIIKGTKYSTTCNHCGQQLWLEKEPLPFMYCVYTGFFIMYLSMQFFLYYCNLGFIDCNHPKYADLCLPFKLSTFASKKQCSI